MDCHRKGQIQRREGFRSSGSPKFAENTLSGVPEGLILLKFTFPEFRKPKIH